ncbi:MAG: glycosyltransferase family 2 protein [Bacteroidota bacterium]|jgi:glycosyltransferase involved in cell wall biosynthesis
MNYPKITVVTPNFNQVNFIEKTIQSVLNQKYPNLEYIIIDGGSTDGSIEVIQKYSKQLFYWVSEKDSGMYHAIQKGFDKSSGEIMTYINSDDILQAHSLFTVAELFIDHPELNWINGFPNQIDEYNRMIWFGGLPNWTKYHYLNMQYKYIQQEGCFWNRKLWNESGGYISTKYKFASDLELWSRFFQFSNLYFVPVALGSFRLRSLNQKTIEHLDKYNDEAEDILKKFQINASYDDKLLIKKYNSIPGKLFRRLKSKVLFQTFGYIDIYQLLSKTDWVFHFDRTLQKFKLNKILK